MIDIELNEKDLIKILQLNPYFCSSDIETVHLGISLLAEILSDKVGLLYQTGFFEPSIQIVRLSKYLSKKIADSEMYLLKQAYRDIFFFKSCVLFEY